MRTKTLMHQVLQEVGLDTKISNSELREFKEIGKEYGDYSAISHDNWLHYSMFTPDPDDPDDEILHDVNFYF